MKRELKIGIFFAAALLILATFILVVGDITVIFKKSGYPLYSYFDSTAGLEKRAVVRMAGVKIGYVKDIRLRGSRAEALMSIDNGVNIPRDSKAALAALGLLGEKYIEISPGKDSEFCEPSGHIQGVSSPSFDQIGTTLLSIGNEVSEVGRALRETLGGDESKAQVRGIIDNLSSFTTELKDFFEVNKGNLDQAIGSSAKAVQNFDQRVKEISGNLDELVFLLKDIAEENRGEVKLNLSRIKELLDQIGDALKLLNESLEKINKGEGTLGKLIQKTELYDNAERTVEEAKKVFQPMSSLRVDIGFSSEYYSKSDWLKSYLSLTLWPTSKKFILAQIVHDPWLDKFTYSAQGGIRWGGFTPRAGIIESSFGVGVDYYLVHDRLRFSLESFDLNRRPRPRFKFWTSYDAYKYFYLVFGIDDFSLVSKREIYFGLGIRLK
ncbi:MAG: MlaD family protein [Candidatus Aminicenantaceae bacterium]